MNKLLSTIFLLALCAAATAQTQVEEVAFGPGEKLEYVVSYRAKLVPNSEVATVAINTTAGKVDAQDALHVWANARVMPFFRWFFDLNDTYNSWMHPKTLKPLKFTSDLREGSYRYQSTVLYDWNTMTASSKYRNLKRPTAKTKTLPLTHASYDAIALFFNLRSSSLAGFVAGQPRYLQVVLDDTVRKVQYQFLGREERNVKGFGRFRTLKFSCQLATSTGESFEDGTEFFLWVTDDRNRIPVHLESPIRVGSIRVRVTKFENLKFPLDSKIK